MKKKVKKSAKAVKPAKRYIRKRTQGGKVSKGMMILVAAIILLAGGGLYYMNTSGKISSPLAGMVKTPLNPNCELKDPELCKFMNNWVNVKKYSMTSTMRDSSGTSMESQFEVDGENKTHMMSKDGKNNYETITIDNTTYTKDFSDGKWFKQTSDPEKVKEFMKDTTDEVKFDDKEAVEDKTVYKSLGKEACGNLTCFKYQIVDPEDTGTTTYLWFDDKEYLLRKQTTTDKDGSTSEVTFSYDNISISAPSPVKEGSPEDMYMQSMSEEDKKQMQEMKQQMQSVPQGESAPDESYGGDGLEE